MYQYPNYPIYQQPRPTFQNNINGKRVATFDEINLNDIPMDGSVAVFLNGDMSEIQTRCWKSDGTIAKVVFRPIEVPEVNVQNADIYARLDKIEAILMEREDEYKSDGTNESKE